MCLGVFKWHFFSADLDNDNHICDYELQELLKSAGHDVPGYKLREIMQTLDRNNDNKISFNEFLAVRTPLFLSLPLSQLSSGGGLLCPSIFPSVTRPLSCLRACKHLALLHWAAHAKAYFSVCSRGGCGVEKPPKNRTHTHIRAQGMWK